MEDFTHLQAAALSIEVLHAASYAISDTSRSSNTFMLAYSNAGFIFFGTMLRSLAASAPMASAARRTKLLEASTGADRAACTEHSGTLLQHSEKRWPLSVLDPVAGLILDSAPSRLTPDIAARHAFLHCSN